MNDMQLWMEEMDLHALREQDHEFSWSNKEEGENRILSKIDHAIGNIPWMSTFSSNPAQYDNAHSSDHCPLLVKVATQNGANTQKPFRFMNYLVHHPDFLRKVETAWEMEVTGTGLERIWRKLKNVKKELKHLHSTEFKGIQRKIHHYEEELDNIQTMLQTTPKDGSLVIREKNIL